MSDLALQTVIPAEILNNDDYILRDNEIVYKSLFEGVQHTELARQYGLSNARISQIVSESLSSERYSNILKLWNRKASQAARNKAMETLNSLNPHDIPEGSKATTIGILIDKARLIDGETVQSSTPGVQVQVVNYGTVNMGKAQDAG